MKSLAKNSGFQYLSVFNQQEFSTLLSLKDWDACWTYLYKALDTIHQNRLLSGELVKDFSHRDGIARVHSFASLLSKIFIAMALNDEIEISDQSYVRMLSQYDTLHDLLFIIGIEQTDEHVQNLLARQKKLSQSQQKKLCLLLSLNTSLEMEKVVQNILLPYRGMALVFYFAGKKNYFGRCEKNKIRLLSIASVIQNMTFPEEAMEFLCKAYFGVSYIDHPQKHDVKIHINKQIRKYMKGPLRRHLRDISSQKNSIETKKSSKPVLLLSVEVLNQDHAMYRSWGRRLKTLNTYFDVHLIGPREKIDRAVKQDYPHTFLIDTHNIDKMFLHIQQVSPDVILMPSVGMHITNVMLSNGRYAPLQIMLLGHPAPTMSNDVDFVLGREELYSPEGFTHDQYIIDPTPVEHYANKYLEKVRIKRPTDTAPKDHVHVCIAGTLQKMSQGFFSLLQDLQKSTPFDIDFTFLLDPKGIEAVATKIALLKTFPSARVFGYQDYKDYLARLSETDIMLNQFPFGNANTLIDALISGKPCVGLDGTQCHSKTVGAILSHVELDKAFLTHSIKEYKEKFFTLSEEIMAGKRYFFDPQEVYNKMYKENKTSEDFGSVVYKIFQNQKTIKAEKQKLIELQNFEREKSSNV